MNTCPSTSTHVPYMMSAGGQQFQNAYATMEKTLGCATSRSHCGANVPRLIFRSTAPYTAYVLTSTQ